MIGLGCTAFPRADATKNGNPIETNENQISRGPKEDHRGRLLPRCKNLLGKAVIKAGDTRLSSLLIIDLLFSFFEDGDTFA